MTLDQRHARAVRRGAAGRSHAARAAANHHIVEIVAGVLQHLPTERDGLAGREGRGRSTRNWRRNAQNASHQVARAIGVKRGAMTRKLAHARFALCVQLCEGSAIHRCRLGERREGLVDGALHLGRRRARLEHVERDGALRLALLLHKRLQRPREAAKHDLVQERERRDVVQTLHLRQGPRVRVGRQQIVRCGGGGLLRGGRHGQLGLDERVAKSHVRWPPRARGKMK
jgi:hypothetical protein